MLNSDHPIKPPARYRYTLTLLLVVYIFNYLDRQVLTILAEQIKHDLSLADWQIGLMSGLAFSLFYTVLGLPMAHLADRWNRPKIIGWSIAVWSAFTALCGAAQGFTHLLLCRIGVGVGEAGCSPAAHSLITDSVPRERRSRALAFYALGNPLGVLFGLALGGLLAQELGWRATFVVVAAPGLALCVLTLLTLKEPRLTTPATGPKDSAGPSFRTTLAYLTRKPTFLLLAFGVAMAAFGGSGALAFTAPYFLRNHADGLAELAAAASELLNVPLGVMGFFGIALGLMAGLCGAFGTWLGGWLGDRFGGHNPKGYLTAPAIGSALATPALLAAYSAPSAGLSLLLLGLGFTLFAIPTGPVYATVQSLAPPNMRAMAAAMTLFMLNLIGTGCGPLVVGLLSDWFNIHMGLGSAAGVRYGILCGTTACLIGGVCFWMARSHIARDLEVA